MCCHIFEPDTVVQHRAMVLYLAHNSAVRAGNGFFNAASSHISGKLGQIDIPENKHKPAGGHRGIPGMDSFSHHHLYVADLRAGALGRFWRLVFFFLPGVFVLDGTLLRK